MNYLERDTLGIYRKEKSGGPGPALMGADTLIGDDVYNLQDEKLGDIKEIMLDMSSGTVAYAVLSFGGLLTVGEKLFAVPWDALKLDTVNKRFLLDVDKDNLKNAPGFDKDNWPDMADQTWINEINSYYGSTLRLACGSGAGKIPAPTTVTAFRTPERAVAYFGWSAGFAGDGGSEAPGGVVVSPLVPDPDGEAGAGEAGGVGVGVAGAVAGGVVVSGGGVVVSDGALRSQLVSNTHAASAGMSNRVFIIMSLGNCR